MRKIPALVALGLALSLALSACGSNAEDPNEADVAFATEMLQHHSQAIEMVDLTEGRPLDPEVAQLARQIKAAQAPEIETMTTWLTEWDEPVPDLSGGMAGMQMDSQTDAGMPGMMTGEEMTALENAPDSEFQQQWLEMMIEHHTGAVEMAATEEAEGQYQPAVDLAVEIQKSQSAEIETMKELLG